MHRKNQRAWLRLQTAGRGIGGPAIGDPSCAEDWKGEGKDGDGTGQACE
jgi:hypothetical protein